MVTGHEGKMAKNDWNRADEERLRRRLVYVEVYGGSATKFGGGES
jgi:hypothetical protein